MTWLEEFEKQYAEDLKEACDKTYRQFYQRYLNHLKLNINNMSEQRVLTNGEFKVGIGFNPGKHEAVEEIKRKAADLIDAVERLGAAHTEEIESNSDISETTKKQRSKEVGRLVSLSMTHIEDAAMWGVKAVTK